MNIIINSEYIKKQINEIKNIFNSDNIDEIAKTTGFVQRKSKLTGTIFLNIFTLGMNMYQRPSLNQLLGLVKIIIPDFEISREGFQQRINESAVKFFEFMLLKASNISIKNIDMELLKSFKRVLILDSTIMELPKELAETFRGYGGSSSTSSLKIQFCYDLKSSHFFYVIQEGTNSDVKYENSFVDKIEKDDLIIKDMGYFNPQSFIEISNKQAYYLSRWKSNIEMYVKDQNDNFFLFDIDKFLTKIDNIVEIDIYIKKEKQYSKARLIIEPVPDEVKNIRLRKLNTESKRRGRKTKDRTKLFCCYNIYVSNIPNKLLLMSNFRNLYRIRWQIELVFKNWKSNFNLDKLSGVKLERIKCMIYSRLLLIFISRKIIYQLKTIYWKYIKVEISEFKASKHLIIVFSEILKLSIKKQSHEISKLLNDSIKFIGKKCTKLKQCSRFNSLDIITSIS